MEPERRPGRQQSVLGQPPCERGSRTERLLGLWNADHLADMPLHTPCPRRARPGCGSNSVGGFGGGAAAGDAAAGQVDRESGGQKGVPSPACLSACRCSRCGRCGRRCWYQRLTPRRSFLAPASGGRPTPSSPSSPPSAPAPPSLRALFPLHRRWWLKRQHLRPSRPPVRLGLLVAAVRLHQVEVGGDMLLRHGSGGSRKFQTYTTIA